MMSPLLSSSMWCVHSIIKKTPYTYNHIVEDFSSKWFVHTKETTTIEQNNEKEVILQVLLVGNSLEMRTNKIQNRTSKNDLFYFISGL